MSSYFKSTVAHAAATADAHSAVALVTGAKSGIGLALARKIASFPFIEQVLAVSRSVTNEDVNHPKITPLAADVGTEEGRKTIVDSVEQLCSNNTKQLRFLVHCAGTIDPIKPVFDIQPDELRRAMNINCEAPFFLTTSLYKYMRPLNDTGVAGRVLHVSSGAAHGAPPVGWGVYGITKAAFFQSFRVLEREFRDGGAKVVVGSFKPGVVDTSMQSTIRNSNDKDMPIVQNFRNMKAKASGGAAIKQARPPPAGALDTPENVAYFAEFLLTGTTDEEFANAKDSNEWDIRNSELFERWILPDSD